MLEAMGFALNSRKTVVANQGMRQTVTGLVVNEKVRTSAQYRRKIRQEIYYCRRYGVREHLKAVGSLNGKETEAEAAAKEQAFLQSLFGRIAYVLQTEPENQEFLEYRDGYRSMLGEKERE